MVSKTIIQVENLSKKYILGHQQKGKYRYKALRDVVADSIKSLSSRVVNPNSRSGSHATREEFWALKDVSFDIQMGDRVGLIGRNGAGKSTLLKILSRITEPTSGRIKIQGRVASLLEVGTGFHPELTGRENIYLNGAILGMSKVEIQRKFDEIVDFAEVEKFLDTPVKRYSSGMYVRLAFAVAAHLEPEILVVDEVLAVGDQQFQKKCLGKMGQVAKEGRTVLFVSHNMAAIQTLCSCAIVLEKGEILTQGNTSDCIATYESRNASQRGTMWQRSPTDKERILAITQVVSILTGKQPNLVLSLEISLRSNESHKPAFLAVDIASDNGVVVMQALPRLEGFIRDTDREQFVSVEIELPPLIPGQYLAGIWVGSHNTETLDEVREVVKFEVYDSPTAGRTFPHTPNHGYIVPPSRIKLCQKTSIVS